MAIDPAKPAKKTLPTPQTREELEALLVRAAELEHVLMCAYLFTAYTLKQDPDEGGFSNDPTERATQQAAVATWSGKIVGVAVQEMLHLALAANLISAIGGEPDFSRKDLDFPLSAPTLHRFFGYTGGAWLGLWPFSELTVRRFIWYEAFEHEDFPGPPWAPPMREIFKPEERRFIRGMERMQVSNLVELYEAIARGFVHLNETLGEDVLFPPERRVYQVTDQEVTGLFNFPPATIVEDGQVKNRPLLIKVVDLSSALAAINTIIVQGEGDTEEWEEFVASLDLPAEVTNFPQIHTPSHHDTFRSVLLGTPPVFGTDPSTVRPASPGYYQLKVDDAEFRPTRPVRQNPLASDPCGGDPPCEERVHVLENELTRDVAVLFDDLYTTMLGMLSQGFRHRSVSSDDTVREYEKATLVQSAIRAMVYLVSPLGNALCQMAGDADGSWNAGPGFTWKEPPASWDGLEECLEELSSRAVALGRRAPEQKIWVSPSYLGVPPAGHANPQLTLRQLFCDHLAPDLLFMADRLRRVRGHAPSPEFEKHVCMGLNACAGQDITGTAKQAGAGECATADPHVCSGQNQCRGQGGCGFSPSASGAWALQNHPGENHYAGQVKDEDGFFQFNPQADSACGSPILPSLKNTFGLNTDPKAGRGGSPETFDRGDGFVWDFARILFEDRMRAQGISYEEDFSGIERYRDLGGESGDD